MEKEIPEKQGGSLLKITHLMKELDTHQGSGKMAAEPQAVQEQRVSGGLGGAPAGIHPSALALIHYLSLPLWASVFAELSSAPQVPF